MWQYIIVALIGLLVFGYIAYRLYKMFYPDEESGCGCSGCKGCGH